MIWKKAPNIKLFFLCIWFASFYSCVYNTEYELIADLVVECPEDVEIVCGEDESPTSTGTPDILRNNCVGDVRVMFEDNLISGNCYTILRSWSIENDCANIVSCIQKIKVENNSVLTLDCPPDRTISCGTSNSPSLTGQASASSNCPGSLSVTYIDSIEFTANCYNIYRLWMAEDECNNSVSCIQTIRYSGSLPSEQAEIIREIEDNMTEIVGGGVFIMGSNDFLANESPMHNALVSTFHLGKFEVTQKEWRVITGSNPTELRFSGCDNCPVESVSWNDIQNFLSQLNRLSGKKYRLPTEAEWEYAYKDGIMLSNSVYSANKSVQEVAWFNENSTLRTNGRGLKEPNKLGLYDMSGNVWEWCNDWYGNYTADYKENPEGPLTGTNKVIRGGSWNDAATDCRSTRRAFLDPNLRVATVGFRLAE